MLVLVDAGVGFDRVLVSFYAVFEGDFTKRRGLSPAECFNLIPLSV